MKPDIIFLDLEGTLVRVPDFQSETNIPVSMWTTLAQMLGEDCYQAEEESKKAWEAKQDKRYLEWMDESVRLFVSFGLNKQILDELVETVEIFPGVREFCQSMSAMGSVIVIITGAIKNIAEAVQIETGARHLFAGCEIYFHPDGAVKHWNLLPSDYEGKADFMRLMIREYNVDSSNCVFIGDGNNDVYLAREVGVSIAYNAQNKLKSIADYVIDQPVKEENFLTLRDLILQH